MLLTRSRWKGAHYLLGTWGPVPRRGLSKLPPKSLFKIQSYTSHCIQTSRPKCSANPIFFNTDWCRDKWNRKQSFFCTFLQSDLENHKSMINGDNVHCRFVRNVNCTKSVICIYRKLVAGIMLENCSKRISDGICISRVFLNKCVTPTWTNGKYRIPNECIRRNQVYHCWREMRSRGVATRGG